MGSMQFTIDQSAKGVSNGFDMSQKSFPGTTISLLRNLSKVVSISDTSSSVRTSGSVQHPFSRKSRICCGVKMYSDGEMRPYWFEPKTDTTTQMENTSAFRVD